jgi:isoaspartyl peptidase/L-asparaginase-like protein (Ntn-hydrolase superfamily)
MHGIMWPFHFYLSTSFDIDCRASQVNTGKRNLKKFFLRNYDWPHGLAEAQRQLLAGSHRHDVLEHAINVIELDPEIDSVGCGGFPNLLGEVELDAAFMDGNGRLLGAIAALKNCAQPVSVARCLMEQQLHTMLSGAGAEMFALEKGFTPTSILTPSMQKWWEGQVRPLVDRQDGTSKIELVRQLTAQNEQTKRAVAQPNDTVAMIACDGNGISVATSTSGWAAKHPGRVGDSPIAGAGFYVDSNIGGCFCFWSGETSMRAGTARYVVAQMDAGKSVHDAVSLAVDDVARLRGGYLDGLVIHAVDRQGGTRVVTINLPEPMNYWYWHEDLPAPELRTSELIESI